MAPTLQDVMMLLSLPIAGVPAFRRTRLSTGATPCYAGFRGFLRQRPRHRTTTSRSDSGMARPCGRFCSSGSSGWSRSPPTTRCRGTSRCTYCGSSAGYCLPADTVTPSTPALWGTRGPSPTMRTCRLARDQRYLPRPPRPWEHVSTGPLSAFPCLGPGPGAPRLGSPSGGYWWARSGCGTCRRWRWRSGWSVGVLRCALCTCIMCLRILLCSYYDMVVYAFPLALFYNLYYVFMYSTS